MKNKKQATEDQLPNLLKSLRPKGDGLQAPDAAYFQALATRIIEEEAQKQPDGPRLQADRGRSLVVPSWWWALAASLLLLLWWSTNNSNTVLPANVPTAQHKTWQNQLDQLSEEDLKAYIHENIQEFELETLLAIND